AAEEIPKATTVVDRIHVIRLAGDALDLCRCRVQIELYSTWDRRHHLLTRISEPFPPALIIYLLTSNNSA
ncbi:hypothetical protein R556_24095, partial [Salmonella enterica subsp. enterica serovar Thompson]